MNRSPDKGSFRLSQNENYEELFKSIRQQQLDLEETDEWKVDNLEYDLRTNQTIIQKCQDPVYAQHIYAALCNNEFRKNEVLPILKEESWSCSWRRAGGIVADIRQEGDYIDWYCSGIRDTSEMEEQEFYALTEQEQKQHLQTKAYVSESLVTDEVKQDLFNMGWLVLEEKIDTDI